MSNGQATLFDMGRPATDKPHPESPLLPVIDESKMIDVPRTSRILGVSGETVRRMIDARLIAGVQRMEGAPYLVEYWSVVRYCDKLRVTYHIPDRRRKPCGGAPRYRDEDILPFPLSDTMSVEEAMHSLCLSKRSVHKRTEEGRFECYRLYDGAAWRISRTSFAVYAERFRLYSQTQPSS